MLWTSKEHSHWINELCFSPQSTYVASCSRDSTVVLWDAQTGAKLRTLTGARDEVRSVSFSQNGELLSAASRDRTIRLWSLRDFSERGIIIGKTMGGAMDFLPDNTIAFGGEGKQLVFRKFPVEGYEDVLPCFSGQEVSRLAISRSGDAVAAISFNEPEVCLWRILKDTASRLEPIYLQNNPGALAVSCNDVVAVGDSTAASLRLFSLTTRQQVDSVVDPRPAAISCAAFSPSGRLLAAGCDDGSAIVWDIRTRNKLFDGKVHSDRVQRLCFCADETTLLTGSSDHSAAVWDVKRRTLIRRFGRLGDWVTCVGASQNGRTLATGQFLAAPWINVWDRYSQNPPCVLKGHTASIWGIAILRDNRTLVSASGDRSVRCWDLPTGEERFRIEGRAGCVCMAMSDDERILAVGDRDGVVRVYRIASVAEVRATPGWWHLPTAESESRPSVP